MATAESKNKSNQQPKKGSNAMKFLIGGLSGCGATLFVQPLDKVKTLRQLSTEKTNMIAIISNAIKNDGALSLYAGLSAGLLRQATYTTTRLGVYNTLEEKFTGADGKPPNFFLKAGMGMTAGAVGSVVGNPAEIALIRMMSDSRLTKEQQRGYKNVFDALIRVVREEGVLTLWRGAGPTIVRAMVLNAAQLASYSQAKELLLATGYFENGIPLHLSASLCSGFIATAASIPVDLAKSKIQTMKVVNGVPEYKGAIDVLVRTAKAEGFLKLWKGFTPYFLRLGPHTVLTFLIQEQLTNLYKSYIS